MKESIFESVLKEKFPFWSELPEQDREYLSANTRALTYQKGTMIHNGAECSGVILVRTGCLRVYMTSESGKEVTLYRLYPGDMCMLSASCVIEAITFDVTIDSEENSECCVISAGAFSKVADKNPQLKIFSLFTGLILCGVGLILTIMFYVIQGLSYSLLGGLVPLVIGLCLILFYKLCPASIEKDGEN